MGGSAKRKRRDFHVERLKLPAYNLLKLMSKLGLKSVVVSGSMRAWRWGDESYLDVDAYARRYYEVRRKAQKI